MDDVICECGWTKYLEEVRSDYSDPDFEWVCSNPNCTARRDN